MNIYDTANRLASEIKQTDEYKAEVCYTYV